MLQSNRVLGSILVWFNSIFCWPLDAKTGYNDFWRQFFWMNVGFVPETIVLILSWLVSGSWCTEISYSWPCPKKLRIMDPYMSLISSSLFSHNENNVWKPEVSARPVRSLVWSCQLKFVILFDDKGPLLVLLQGLVLSDPWDVCWLKILAGDRWTKDNRITHAC